MKKISVIGQGYVGLPLVVALLKIGHKVIGIDIDKNKIELLNKGLSPVEDITDQVMQEVKNSGRYIASTEFTHIATSEIVMICVPTPLNSDGAPDLSFLKSAVKCISGYLKKETLVILESTVEPGTTRNLVVDLIESGSNLKIENFYLAFSPERIDPQNSQWNILNTPKLVAGLTKESCEMAYQFYSSFVDKVVPCDSLEVAETAKLLENTFRFVNISFINEFSIICDKLGVNVNHVIQAAATKPYGFMPFYPSIGVGGHCIPVDPIYLSNSAKQVGASTNFIDLADKVNKEIPSYYVSKARSLLGDLRSKKIIVIGVAYKPNVSDVRETPVENLIFQLKKELARVSWHDDLVKEWNGEKSIALSSDFDLAILATPHNYLDLLKLGDVPILNTRGSIL